MGLKFRAASILTRVLANSSSEDFNRPKTILWHLLVVPTSLSHHPPHQAAQGAMNFYLLTYWDMKEWILAAERFPDWLASIIFAACNVRALSV
jgi:hypothetical protein